MKFILQLSYYEPLYRCFQIDIKSLLYLYHTYLYKQVFFKFWPQVQNRLYFFLENTCRKESVLQNTSQWLLPILNWNQTFRDGMRFCFPNSRSSAFTFFPHQNVPPLLIFISNFSCEGYYEGIIIISISLFFDRQKADDEFHCTAPV